MPETTTLSDPESNTMAQLEQLHVELVYLTVKRVENPAVCGATGCYETAELVLVELPWRPKRVLCPDDALSFIRQEVDDVS